MESEIAKKIQNKGMIISRMPDWAKEIIKEVASAEHADDYGAAVAQFVREANEYRLLKAKFFNNDLNVTISYPQQEEPKKEDSGIRFANGKKLNTQEVKR